ncbi:type 1 fimbria pilin [Variovorax boronicumulans]|uniref:fimbrial protein n=1 Tax=Variovorax TaxID=34072 RepID=UPI002788E61A|nr:MULTISPECIES: fimbrial protein [Variovorax]MDQ0037063.1 type 1 fimbria pilin [Variovorax boronicumulans]MDQ0611083.1 type 1 fimbria pilin [Variovorax sp. W1I1]
MNPNNLSGKTKALASRKLSVMPLVLGMGLLPVASGAGAACLAAPDFVQKNIAMDMGRVVIPNDMAVGAVFKTQRFTIPVNGASEALSNCVNGGSGIGRILQGDAVPGRENVFTTQVPGVGIRFSREISENDGSGTQTFYPHTLRYNGNVGVRIFSPSFFTVELMKIAATTGNGPLAQGTYTTYTRDGDGSVMINSFLSGLGITIITPSCSVDAGSKNIPVEFGKVPQSNFKGRGTTTGGRNFNIRLNCKAGQNAENTVLLRMDAQQDPSNEQGVLRVTQLGTATAGGVGIQVIDGKNVPVRFGDEVEVGPSKEGDYVLPYTARYYQTGDRVTPGRANGIATFTIAYK